MPNDSPVIPKESYIKHPKPLDYLARFSGTSIEQLDLIAVRPTETVAASFNNFFKRFGERESILVNVIKKQKNLIDYNSHYIAYLLDQMTQDEFYRIAEGFAYSTEQCDESDIEKKTLLLLETTEISFSASDLSYFWGCSEDGIENVLEKLKANRRVR